MDRPLNPMLWKVDRVTANHSVANVEGKGDTKPRITQKPLKEELIGEDSKG